MKYNFWKVIVTILTLIMTITQIFIMCANYQIIKTQTYLIETSKEANYSAEFLNIIDLVGKETQADSYTIDSIRNENILSFDLSSDFKVLTCNIDSLSVKLSPNLKNRIASFTNYISPYPIANEEGKLSDKSYSPERRKLLIYLINSYADLDNMLFYSKFSNIRLDNFDIRNRRLRGLNMDNSYLDKCSFYKCNLSSASFDESLLKTTAFKYCNLIPSDFEHAILDTVSFEYSCLPHAIHFKGAEIKYINLKNAIVPSSDWLDKMKVYLKDIGNLNDYEICKHPCDTLYSNTTHKTLFYKINLKS